ncbi:MAG: ABC transporter permease subunit [Actinomycetia bacterium]|nr:ABC transporter permease subunit [Actinomycetes bacterium]
MTSTSTLASTQATKPPWYRDTTIVKWFAQVAALVLVVGALAFLAIVGGDNLEAKDIATDFDFLNINQGFDISEGIDSDPDTGGRALWVGIVNTLRLAVAGMFVATILGVLIGVARLSQNWMVNKAASAYIETLRNIPVIVQIFIYAAVLGGLGRLTADSDFLWGLGYISAKGVSLPRVFVADGFYQWAVFLVIGSVVGFFVHRNRVRLQESTGRITYPNLWALGVLTAFAIVGWFAHPMWGFLSGVFGSIGDAWDSIPQILMQLLLSALVVFSAASWIRRFLDSKRTPAGLAKLTDDDIFRIIFAGVGGVIGLLFLMVLWPGLSSWIVNSGSDFWHFLADKFGDGRSGQPVDAMMPTIEGEGTLLKYGPQGLTMTVGFAAMFLGVTLYTAAFIAEIVRGGILAVPKGQSEAASAIGLNRAQSLRQVILPQAFRVSLPPLGNQYLNLTKNTSLGIAVGYADVVSIGNTLLNQSGKALSVIALWMLFYLACSLSISVVVNWFNVRMKIVER